MRPSSSLAGNNYSKASIYKILCSDGKFYIGSTVLPLATRFGQHRRAVEKGTANSKVYRHIRTLGGAEQSRIELVKTDLGVTTRDGLLRVEDSYIREALKSKLCLNRNKPRATSEERLAREMMQKRMWTKVNRDIRSAGARGRVDLIPVGERVRQYYREHKMTLPRNPADIMSCECGWDVKRCDMGGHRRSREHKQESARWLLMKEILRSSGVVA